jgi:hypothetical protein
MYLKQAVPLKNASLISIKISGLDIKPARRQVYIIGQQDLMPMDTANYGGN